jgi:hypothetical protein
MFTVGFMALALIGALYFALGIADDSG